MRRKEFHPHFFPISFFEKHTNSNNNNGYLHLTAAASRGKEETGGNRGDEHLLLSRKLYGRVAAGAVCGPVCGSLMAPLADPAPSACGGRRLSRASCLPGCVLDDVPSSLYLKLVDDVPGGLDPPCARPTPLAAAGATVHHRLRRCGSMEGRASRVRSVLSQEIWGLGRWAIIGLRPGFSHAFLCRAGPGTAQDTVPCRVARWAEISGTAQPALRAVPARPSCFRAGPGFVPRFSGRARASPLSTAQIYSSSPRATPGNMKSDGARAGSAAGTRRQERGATTTTADCIPG